MIRLYFWPTPNGWKVSIALEEFGLPYQLVPVDLTQGEQFRDRFAAISPNNKIPAIVDPDGPTRDNQSAAPFSLFESGAILWYLAEKHGRFLPTDPAGRYDVMQWLMFQMGGLGPSLGQAHHFRIYATENIPYAVDRYTNEAARLYGVLDRRLAEAEYLAHDYSIADMAAFPWIFRHQRHGQKLEDFANVKRWYDAIAARPAVQKGLAVLADQQIQAKMDAKQRENLFGGGSNAPDYGGTGSKQ